MHYHTCKVYRLFFHSFTRTVQALYASRSLASNGVHPHHASLESPARKLPEAAKGRHSCLLVVGLVGHREELKIEI